MKYNVSHLTTYEYTQPVPICHNEVHLAPRSLPRQTCTRAQLTVSPTPSSLQTWTDFFGNYVGNFSIEEPHSKLSIAARSVVEVLELPKISDDATPAWDSLLPQLKNPLKTSQPEEFLAASQFLFCSTYITPSKEAADYALVSFTPGTSILAAARDLTRRIFTDFKYDPQATAVNTPTSEVFRKRRGVCQDFAHLQITCLRSIGLAARYVSGYLLSDPPAGQTKLVGADASHAWLSVFCGPAGWIDFDPTNNCIPGLRHITLGWGRDYDDVCPIKGIFLGGGQHSMSVAVDVTPITEAEVPPR